MVDESSFFERLRKKDYDRAFDQLYYESFIRLRQYASGILRSEEQAQDVIQNVFSSLWERRFDLAGMEGSVGAYLYKSVYYASLNELKRKDVRQVNEKGVLREIYNGGVFNDGTLDFREAERRLADGVALLPEKCREIFCMSRFSGMRRGEIAESLGVSVRTVDAQLFNALKRLENFLQEE
ncbi:DNA-directed RNA polymerase sigma-70 factor (plasmid) [Fulvitalea axinellae]|uniref:DNA-directed RNA polymerase sigma-70 factor n=1 Tax=Fulvitalea axinellae TaxID=1182444 RepID=A0AAU9D6A5_9BACT|nr:DNA-directed RNA polymerase sigma-70 factor [Fulvitalea axinellae]